MFEDATFSEVLDDLASRFIINVPEEELQEIERICFQIEQAHWFYEDFVREKNRSMPSMSLKTFAARMFKHCPLLSQWAHDAEAAYQTFLDYKFKVPVCGAIILNPELDKVLLVKGWSSRSSWGFPRGKINKDEPEWQCAQREVIEETGFDILPFLVEKQRIELMQADQKISLYIITGIPEETEFLPMVRKEISQILWHNIADLPCNSRQDRGPTNCAVGNMLIANGVPSGSKGGAEKEHRYYLIKPFAKRIKAWVAKHPEKIGKPAVVVNKKGQPPASAASRNTAPPSAVAPAPATTASPALFGGSGAMSVQELFKTVGRARSPASSSPLSQTPAHQQHQYQMSPMFGSPSPVPHVMGAPENKAASLLQTLMGSGGRASPAPVLANANGDYVQGGDSSKFAALSNLMRQTGISSTPSPQSNSTAISSPAPLHYQQQQFPQAAAGGGGFVNSTPLREFMFDTRTIMNEYYAGN
ncbi:mRNA-decapping enzyme subunit 2 [Kickxella alabastrina]|nr:mRNA-decapping enzyme subunit 2 [Kickxella alabastrina]